MEMRAMWCLLLCFATSALLSSLAAAGVEARSDLSELPPEIQQSIRESSGTGELPARCRSPLSHWTQLKCSSARSKWTYRPASGRCEWFAHYGCQLGSGNVFSSRRDCHAACVRGVQDLCDVARCTPISSLYKSECFQASDSACIEGILKMFKDIHDPEIRRIVAQPDIDVRCQAPVARCRHSGIDIRLPVFEAPAVLEPLPAPDYCHLPPDRGFCPPGKRARLSRGFFYNSQRNECKFMMNFGCGRNHNQFASLAQCQNACAL